MKKYLFILLLTGLSLAATAQGPFDGFLKPVNSDIFALKSTVPGEKAKRTLIVRPHVEFQAGVAIYSTVNKRYEGNEMSAAGAGLSLANYIDNNGEAFNNWSVNALALINWSINGEQQVRISPALTFSYMKFVSIGVGYLTGPADGRNGWQRIMPMTGISYNW